MDSEQPLKAVIVANSADHFIKFNDLLKKLFQTKNSSTLESTLDLVDDFEPHIVVMDESIANASAQELIHIIRNDTVINHYTSIIVIADPKNKKIEKLQKQCNTADMVLAWSELASLENFAVQAIRIKHLEDNCQTLAKKLTFTTEAVRELETQDTVTRLYNLPYLSKLAESQVRISLDTQTNFSVLIVSINSFRRFAYAHGPKASIKVIQQMADTLNDLLREDDLIGRSWGGEFVCILPETDTNGALVLAERIVLTIKQKRFGLESDPQQISISQGISHFNHEMEVEEGAQLLLKAANYLIQAKKKAPNSICYQGQEEAS